MNQVNKLFSNVFLSLLRGALAKPNDAAHAAALSDWLLENDFEEFAAMAAAMPVWWPLAKEVMADYCHQRRGDPVVSTIPWTAIGNFLMNGPLTQEDYQAWRVAHGFYEAGISMNGSHQPVDGD